jgi:hypothetical protein
LHPALPVAFGEVRAEFLIRPVEGAFRKQIPVKLA